jgi:hypothetical protein
VPAGGALTGDPHVQLFRPTALRCVDGTPASIRAQEKRLNNFEGETVMGASGILECPRSKAGDLERRRNDMVGNRSSAEHRLGRTTRSD